MMKTKMFNSEREIWQYLVKKYNIIIEHVNDINERESQ